MKHRTLLVLTLLICSISAVAQETPQPTVTRGVVYAIVIDTSKSIGSQFSDVLNAANTVIDKNRPADEAMIVRFTNSDDIETTQTFTPSKDDLHSAVNKLYTRAGQSAVIDAIYVAAKAVAEHTGAAGDSRRTAIVLISDGEDRRSFYKQKQLLDLLRKNKIRIYSIGLLNYLDNQKPLFGKSAQRKAGDLLNTLATETGGRVFFLESYAELPGIADEISNLMREN